jgi:hypothetical protein
MSTEPDKPENLPWTYPGFWQDYSFALAALSITIATLALGCLRFDYFYHGPTDRFMPFLPVLAVGIVVEWIRPIYKLKTRCELGNIIKLIHLLVTPPQILFVCFIAYRLVVSF